MKISKITFFLICSGLFIFTEIALGDFVYRSTSGGLFGSSTSINSTNTNNLNVEISEGKGIRKISLNTIGYNQEYNNDYPPKLGQPLFLELNEQVVGSFTTLKTLPGVFLVSAHTLWGLKESSILEALGLYGYDVKQLEYYQIYTDNERPVDLVLFIMTSMSTRADDVIEYLKNLPLPKVNQKTFSYQLGSQADDLVLQNSVSNITAVSKNRKYFYLPLLKKQTHSTYGSSGSQVFLLDQEWKLGGVTHCLFFPLNKAEGNDAVKVISLNWIGKHARLKKVKYSELLSQEDFPISRDCIPIDPKDGGGF